MTIDTYILAHPDDADALAAYEADPAGWQPVPSKNVLGWLGENGRFAKLKGFIAATADATDPQTIGLRSAVEVVLLAVNNQSTELLFDPASLHRTMLLVLVGAGVLDQSDADALIARGRPAGFAAYTVEQVAACRAERAVERAKTTLRNQWVAVHNAVIAGIDDGTLTDWDDVLAKAGA